MSSSVPSKWNLKSIGRLYLPCTLHKSWTGSRSKLPQHLMRACFSSFLLSKMDFQSPSASCHHQSENITSSGNISIAVMVLSSTRTASSFYPICLSTLHAAHQGTSAMTAKAEASIFWPGITEDIQTTRANCLHCNRWPHHKWHCHPSLPPNQYTHSSAYMQTTSTTMAIPTSSLLIAIPNGQQ